MTALDHYILDAVRIGLSACVASRPRRHPDSSRQRKTKQRDVARYEVRRMKAQQSTYLPKLATITRVAFDYAGMERVLLAKYGTDYATANRDISARTGRWTGRPNFVEVDRVRPRTA